MPQKGSLLLCCFRTWTRVSFNLKKALRCVELLQVEAIQSVCPEVTDAEAVKALELCGDRFAAAPVAFSLCFVTRGACALNRVRTVTQLEGHDICALDRNGWGCV